MKKIIIITGQTATGKTKLAFELAQKYNGQIINCDSRQIYKKLDIITGKDLPPDQFHLENKVNNFDIGYYSLLNHPRGALTVTPGVFDRTPPGCSAVRLWLYDIVSPNQYFSSFDYKTCALPVIKKLFKENKTPILVGGTYFYLKHLLYGVETENVPPNQELRKELNKKPVQELQQILQKLSVQSFNRLNNSDINNPQRLIRRIEIIKFNACHPDQRGGIPFEKDSSTLDPLANGSRSRNDKMFIDKYAVEPSRLRSEARYNPVPGEAGKPTRLINGLNVTFLGLRYKNKDDLKKAIIKRVEKRLKQGAIDEVKNLLNNGYTENDPGLKTIGYVQIIKYLKGDIAKEKAIEEWITREIQYAKRQYTFMKKDQNIKWKEINS